MQQREALAIEMVELFGGDDRLERADVDTILIGVTTERERAVRDRLLPVYRQLFRKRRRTG